MKSLRPWATPLTIATTLVTLVTGALLFFHISPGLTRLGHEWIGMIMVAAVVAHLVLNWRPFKTYFKRPVGLSLIVLGVVVTALTFVIPPAPEGQGGSPVAMVMGAMGAAEISVLADLAHKDLDVVLAELTATGVTVDADTTLATAAGGNRGEQMALLRTILGD